MAIKSSVSSLVGRNLNLRRSLKKLKLHRSSEVAPLQAALSSATEHQLQMVPQDSLANLPRVARSLATQRMLPPAQVSLAAPPLGQASLSSRRLQLRSRTKTMMAMISRKVRNLRPSTRMTLQKLSSRALGLKQSSQARTLSFLR